MLQVRPKTHINNEDTNTINKTNDKKTLVINTQLPKTALTNKDEWANT